MAVGSVMRLNSAMSILLVALLVLGGMASMSSLEMNDASAADGNDANEKMQDNSKEKSNSEWLEKCEDLKNKDFDKDLGDWAHLRGEKSFEWDRNKDEVKSTNGRQSDNSSDNNTVEDTDEIDWHLPDYISVEITDSGYSVTIRDELGLTTENYTEEEFSSFLERFGWESNAEGDERDDENRNRTDYRERVENLRESCENGDDDSCLELRGIMARLREGRDRGEREEIPDISLELLDDSTIIAHREFSNGNFEYDIISTADNGDLTIVRVSAWGTDVIHPQPTKNDRNEEKRDKGHFESAHKSLENMSDRDFRAMCKEHLGDEERTPIDVNFERLDRAPMERESERR